MGCHQRVFAVVEDVDVVALNAVIRRGQGDGLERDRPVFPRASAEHTKQIRPAGHPGFTPEGRVVQRYHEGLPRENLLEGEILREREVVIRELLVDVYILGIEAFLYVSDERPHLLARP